MKNVKKGRKSQKQSKSSRKIVTITQAKATPIAEFPHIQQCEDSINRRETKFDDILPLLLLHIYWSNINNKNKRKSLFTVLLPS